MTDLLESPKNIIPATFGGVAQARTMVAEVGWVVQQPIYVLCSGLENTSNSGLGKNL